VLRHQQPQHGDISRVLASLFFECPQRPVPVFMAGDGAAQQGDRRVQGIGRIAGG